MITLGRVEFGEDFGLRIDTWQYFLCGRKCVYGAPDVLIQTCVIDNQSQITVLFSNEESWCTPFPLSFPLAWSLRCQWVFSRFALLFSLQCRGIWPAVEMRNGVISPGVRWIFIATHPVFIELLGKSSVRTSGLSLIRESRMLEYRFSVIIYMGFGNCLGMTPNFFKSSRPRMISFVNAGEMTKTESIDRLEILRLTGAVPSVATGSPLTLTYFLLEGLEDWIPYFLARSDAINVAALPVSKKVLNVKDPFLCEILRVSLFTQGSASSYAGSTSMFQWLP